MTSPQYPDNEVHSCSHYCERPACVKAQRDRLRDQFVVSEKQPPEDDRVLRVRNAMAGRAVRLERGEGMFSSGIIAEELRHWIDQLDEAMQ